MLPELEKLNLSDLSQIKVEFSRGPSQNTSYLDILIVKYVGHYLDGAAGNADARYMYAMGKAALNAFEPSGLIIDLSELKYEWGDMLEIVFDMGAEQVYHGRFPMATVVGPECQEAIRTLIHGIDSEKSIDEIDWMFDTLDRGWNYVDSLLTRN